MRTKTAYLFNRFTAMNKRWLADRYLDNTQRINITAAGYPPARRKFPFHPWFIGWCPAGIEDHGICPAHPGWQRKFRVTDCHTVAFYQITILKNVHPECRRIYHNTGVLG